jgi:hypothetical protein
MVASLFKPLVQSTRVSVVKHSEEQTKTKVVLKVETGIRRGSGRNLTPLHEATSSSCLNDDLCYLSRCLNFSMHFVKKSGRKYKF